MIFVTFSAMPHVVELKGETLWQKIANVGSRSDVFHTDMNRVINSERYDCIKVG